MGRRAKPTYERIAEITAARDELRDIFTEAGLPPVFPRLRGEVYPPRGGTLSCAGIVSRVRAAINRCEHAPEYTADSTIKQKVLAALAKDGRQDNAAAFEAFDTYQFVMATATEPVDDASQQPQSMTATAPAADAPPSINAFRATGKSESAAQAEYKQAANAFHNDRRDVECAAEANKRRALEASIAQTLAAEAAWERRMARYEAEQKQYVDELVREKYGPNASWCARHRMRTPARPHAHARPSARASSATSSVWQAPASHHHDGLPPGVPSVGGGARATAARVGRGLRGAPDGACTRERRQGRALGLRYQSRAARAGPSPNAPGQRGADGRRGAGVARRGQGGRGLARNGRAAGRATAGATAAAGRGAAS